MKTFYSAEDIENLAAQGVHELAVDENTVLTDLARDMAAQVGVKLVDGGQRPAIFRPPAPPMTPGAAARPRGCQHGPLAVAPALSGDMAPAPRAGSSPVVDELVGAVRQLAGRQGTRP